jgi:DNA-binding MarR family transcriptional regulator
MKIEEEIKQGTFKSEYHKLLVNQLFTGKWVAEIIAKHLKDFDLTSEQYNVLRILRGQYPGAISVNAICERMIDKMSNVSRLVDKLQNKDLVDRKVNLQDRRQMDISITEKGLKLLDLLDKKEDLLIQRLEHLSPEEASQLNTLLDKLRN